MDAPPPPEAGAAGLLLAKLGGLMEGLLNEDDRGCVPGVPASLDAVGQVLGVAGPANP